MAALVDDVPARADEVDAKAGARCDRRSAVCFIPEQSPVRTLEEVEEPRRLPRGAANRCIGCTIAGLADHHSCAFRPFQRQRGSLVAEVQLMDLAAPSHLA